jgi:hypothetical protein
MKYQEAVVTPMRISVHDQSVTSFPQEGDMRDVYEVLRAKESRIEQLVRELEALRLVAGLLTDDSNSGSEVADAASFRTESDIPSLPSRGRAGKGRMPVAVERHDRAGFTDEAILGAAKRISGRLKRLATPLLNAANPAS